MVGIASDVLICNMALGMLGRSTNPIQTLADTSVEGRTCALWYDQARREVLEIQDWSFARARVTLAPHNDPPPPEWAFRYQLPAACLAFRRIYNPFTGQFPQLGTPTGVISGSIILSNVLPQDYGEMSNAIPWELESSLDGQMQTLLTNQTAAVGIYTRDTTLVQLFSPQFINTFTHYLAGKMAYMITGKLNVEEKEGKSFQGALGAAASSNANQGVASPIRDGYSVRARL